MFSLKSIFEGWDHFFFSKTNPAGLCLFRVFFGFFLVLNGVCLLPDLSVWFGVGDQALFPLAESLQFSKGVRFNVFQWLAPNELSAEIVIWTYILFSFFFMVGFKTRLSAVVCFLLIVSIQNRNFAILNSGDTLMRCLLFPMMFAPSNVKFSIDSFLRTKARDPFASDVSILTIRLLQIQFSLVYLATTLFKLKGYDWVDGTAVYYTSRLINFQRFVIPFFFDYPFLIKTITWGALFIEFAMGSLVWIKELRLAVLICGIALHLIIEVTMSIGFFEWIMIGVYVLFLTPGEINLLKSKIIPNAFYRLRPSLG